MNCKFRRNNYFVVLSLFLTEPLWCIGYATGCVAQGSNPGKGELFFFSAKGLYRLSDLPSLVLNVCRYSFPVINRPGRDVDHSSPTSAKVKSKWIYTFTPPIRFHGM